MPEWIQPLLGQSGALIILLIIGRGGFIFFKGRLEKQDIEHDKQAERFYTLQKSTLEAINQHTIAIKELIGQIRILLKRG